MNRHDDPEDSSLAERCLTGGLPEFGGNTGSFRRIVQTPGGISIFYDVGQGQGWQRNIVMDGSPHLPADIRQWFGDSRGHWEGNTLVIDVTNFSPKTDVFGSRENLHLVERWTRTGPTTLEYEVTIEDPTVWTRPWTVKQEFTKQSDQENRIYYEPRCVEGNYGFPAMMKAARLEDREFAEGRGPDPLTKDNASGGADRTRCSSKNVHRETNGEVMRDRFSGSMTDGRHCDGRGGRRHFGVRHTDVGSGPAASGAAPALKTPWGEPDLQGIWTDESDTPLQRSRQVCEPGIFHRGAAGRIGQAASGTVRPRQARGARDRGRRHRRLQRGVHAHEAHRRAHVADRRSAQWPASAADARGSEARPPPNGNFVSPCCNRPRRARTRSRPVTAASTIRRPRRDLRNFRLATTPARMNRHYGPEDATLAERCLTGGLPEFGGISFRRIVQTPGGIAMFYDVGQGQGWQRNIVMDGSPHLPAGIRQWYGDSRGHWEGNTLVIDVTNFSPKTDFQGSRENLHLVERWTRTGPTSLEYVVTIEDPTVWTRPWTVKQEFTRQSDQENRIYYEPRCTEGNYRAPGPVAWRRAGRARLCGGTRSRSGDQGQRSRLFRALNRIRCSSKHAAESKRRPSCATGTYAR